MRPWWEKWPERLDFELAQLEAARIRVKKASKDATSGTLELQLEHTLNGRVMQLVVRFSAFFPYTRFELFAPELDLKHHQNPFLKNVCLIGRGSENWDIDDTVADFILNRLPAAIAAAEEEDKDKLAGVEIQQAEPLTAYYPYADDSSVLIDTSWDIPKTINGGTLLLGIERLDVHTLRGAVLAVRDGTGHVSAQASAAVRDPRAWKTTIECQWIRTDNLPREPDPKRFLNSLPNHGRNFSHTRISKPEVSGVLFSEEIGWRKFGDGWLFVVRFPSERDGFRPGYFFRAYFARPSRAGATDLGARIPELSVLRQKKVAVIGLGALGAPSALEFARAGVAEIRIMDGDTVEAPTTVRWPLGLEAVGRSKVEVLSAFIRTNYPYTTVSMGYCMFGAVPGLGGTDLNSYEKFLAGIDLIYDATAEGSIHYLLSEVAREKKLPYIAVSATPGAWGGRIVRILPDMTRGCWLCLMKSIDEGSIASPAADSAAMVQSAGCASPTFTGSNFELGHIPPLGVRFAVSALCAGSLEGFPDQPDIDVAVLTLRRERQLLLPQWVGYKLQRHPSCTNH
jgi:molybdopterin/thiamine biosynthesis adenylyltransferase